MHTNFFVSNFSSLALLSKHLLKVLLVPRVPEPYLASLPPAYKGKAYLKSRVINVELKWEPTAQELCSLVPVSSPRNAPHSDCSLG